VIRRVGARVWLPFLITSWGACVLGMGFVHSWEVLAVLRALLGIFEAGCRFYLFPWSVKVSMLTCRSVPWCCLHYRIVVSTVRDGKTRIDLLHGGAASFGVWTDCKSSARSGVAFADLWSLPMLCRSSVWAMACIAADGGGSSGTVFSPSGRYMLTDRSAFTTTNLSIRA
jgi:hypothetical protein